MYGTFCGDILSAGGATVKKEVSRDLLQLDIKLHVSNEVWPKHGCDCESF